jgi:polar amino acid transport system substrate-binding protein
MRGSTVRKLIIGLAVFGLLAAACAEENPVVPAASPSAGETAADCAKGVTTYVNQGQLTIATDNPAFAPWFGGKASKPGSPWKAKPSSGTGDPYSGEGFESAVAYAVAGELGFGDEQVTWVPVNFNQSYKPGPKDFDFFIGQVSYSPVRAQAVDFSDGYYNVQQALVVKKGTPITEATTFADLRGYKLGAQIGTTSYSYIVDNIQPDEQPNVYDNSNDVIAALNAGQIDGIVVDAPTAYVMVLIGEVPQGTVVGQFPTIGDQEHFGMVFGKGNPLVTCVNQAIADLTSAGTLDAIQAKWLKALSYPTIAQS